MTLVCRHCGSGDIYLLTFVIAVCMECGKEGVPIDAGDYHDRMEVKGGKNR